jgi:hypothetical protein
MSLFLLTFFSLYGGIHYYVYRKVGTAFPLTFSAAFSLIMFMLIMVSAPLCVRLLEKEGLGSVAVPLAFVGYLWMGFLFLLFLLLLISDLGQVLIRYSGLLFSRDFSFCYNDRQAFLVAFFVSLGISCYGYYEATAVRLEKVVIPTTKLPLSLRSFKIVQVSDVHLGLIVKEQRLGKIIKEIELAKPDLLVSTGDLVDGQIDGMTALSTALEKIHTPFGKIAVTGNHEYHAGITNSLNFMKQAGFTVLQENELDVAGFITVVGVDDPAGKRFGYGKIPEEVILGKVPPGRFVLLLKHRPVVAKQSVGLFDLQLSGHIHKGQIFPFEVLTHLFYPVKTGLSLARDVSNLYVSRGTGTWGPPIRFLAPPEITVIELVNLSAEE